MHRQEIYNYRSSNKYKFKILSPPQKKTIIFTYLLIVTKLILSKISSVNFDQIASSEYHRCNYRISSPENINGRRKFDLLSFSLVTATIKRCQKSWNRIGEHFSYPEISLEFKSCVGRKISLAINKIHLELLLRNIDSIDALQNLSRKFVCI